MTIKVGIIGTGSISIGVHAPTIMESKGAKITAVLSRNIEKGKEFLSNFQIDNGAVYDKLDDFLSDANIDAVIICSPDKIHFEQASKSLLAGKHVLLEKPMVTSNVDAGKIQNIVQDNGCIFAMSYHLRCHEGHKKLKDEIINQKSIGKISHIRIIWAFPMSDDNTWRAKKAVGKWWSLAAVGTHCIDLVRWFLEYESSWKQFNSTISNSKWNGLHDETAVLSGQTSTGITFEITSSVQFGPYTKIEIFGEGGVAICDNTLSREGGGSVSIDGREIIFEKINPFKVQFQSFIDEIHGVGKSSAGIAEGVVGVKDLIMANNV